MLRPLRPRDQGRLGRAPLGGAALALAFAAACSAPTGSPYDGTCPLFQLVETIPIQGARQVSPLTPVTFRFSDFPDPDTTFYPTVTVTSGYYRYTARSGVDLARRTVVIQSNNGLPAGVEVTALATTNLRSLHGCPVYQPPDRDGDLAVLLQFRTAESATPVPATAPPTGPEVVSLLAARCAGGCHAVDASTCLAEPAGHLSLCASEALAALDDVPSRERPSSTLVLPRDSAHSYLVRKLLGAPPASAARHGDLDDDEVAWLERWIEAAAPP